MSEVHRQQVVCIALVNPKLLCQITCRRLNRIRGDCGVDAGGDDRGCQIAKFALGDEVIANPRTMASAPVNGAPVRPVRRPVRPGARASR